MAAQGRKTRSTSLVILVLAALVLLIVGPNAAFISIVPKSISAPRVGIATDTPEDSRWVSGAVGRSSSRLGVARNALSVADSVNADGLELAGKVALVTGASRGIGAAIAEKLARAGATVIGTATSKNGAKAIGERFVGELNGKGMELNVLDAKSVKKVLDTVTKEFGGIDILVNNAGITKDNLMMRMKAKEWDDVINTNLNSIFGLTKAVLKGMSKSRWGRIISISSVVGSMGNAGQTNYAAAKAGMDGFSRALAAEVGSRGITVNTVAPGFIETDMTATLKDEWKAALMQRVPLGRLGQPYEIADAVLFLASPRASYVSGQTLHVNGAMYM